MDGLGLIRDYMVDTCKIAIMSYGRPDKTVKCALFSAGWSEFHKQIWNVIQGTAPIAHDRPCGGWAPFVCKTSLTE